VQRNRILGPVGIVWLGVTLGVIAFATKMGLLMAPTEATMGNSQRIFYYHVPSSMLSLSSPMSILRRRCSTCTGGGAIR